MRRENIKKTYKKAAFWGSLFQKHEKILLHETLFATSLTKGVI